MDNFKNSNAFLMIPVGIERNKRLIKKPKAILLAGEIISMLNVTGEFYIGNKELAKRLDTTVRTIQDYLKLLEQEGIIKREIIRDESNNVVKRTVKAGDKLADAFSEGWKTNRGETDNTPPVTQNTTPPVVSNTPLLLSATPKYNNVIEHNNNTHTKKESVKQKEKQFTAEFEKLWQEYPKKQGKKNALRHYIAWRKAEKNNTPEFMLKKIQEYKNYISVNRITTRYIKNGDTFFNSGYEDDFSTNTQTEQPSNYGYVQTQNKFSEVDDDNLPFWKNNYEKYTWFFTRRNNNWNEQDLP